jgi:hypothetical protein
LYFTAEKIARRAFAAAGSRPKPNMAGQDETWRKQYMAQRKQIV